VVVGRHRLSQLRGDLGTSVVSPGAEVLISQLFRERRLIG